MCFQNIENVLKYPTVIYLKLLDDHLIVSNRLSQNVYSKYNPICNFALSFSGDIGFCESWPEKYSINCDGWLQYLLLE